MAIALEDPASLSPARLAWRRWRHNRWGVAGAAIVCLLGLLGLMAPVLARYATHFSEVEQHTALKLMPPGTRDISHDYPSYDGDPATFAEIDRDSDGRIACRRDVLTRPPIPGLPYLTRFSPELADDVRQALDLRAAAGLDPGAFLAETLGPLQCPEISRLNEIFRFYEFLFTRYDLRSDGAVPSPDDSLSHYGDGRISRAEFPRDDTTLEPAYAGRQLTGARAFAVLDANHDGYLIIDEVLAATRFMRHDAEALVALADRNHDLAISQSEYPGAPELHTFWLGTDAQGRDLLTRLLFGARISLTVGLLATLVAFVVGVSYGTIAGYLGGRVDNLMMRIVDVLYGLPFMFLLILLLVIVGRSLLNLFVALGLIQWLTMARLVRGQVLALKSRTFVRAAEGLGLPRRTIIWRHLIRNALGPVIAYATLMVPSVIMEEAFLSFVGLGLRPPFASWGVLIAEGSALIDTQPHLILWPAGALALTLYGLNFFGDGLRDALDPRAESAS